jgi:GntR family transcriptional regulator
MRIVAEAARKIEVLSGLSPVEPADIVPLYHQVKESLALQIASGRWRPGEELPSEADLCRFFGVSRGTIRRAVGDLSQQGLVQTRQGRGTFVSRPKFEGSILGSYRLFREKGVKHDPASIVRRCERRTIHEELRDMFGLPADAEVYEVERVQFMDRVPMTVHTSVFPADLVDGLERVDLSQQTIYDILEERFNLFFVRAEETLEPAVADDYVARALTIAVGTPLFSVERHSFTQGDRMAEYRHSYMRGDRYKYRIEFR